MIIFFFCGVLNNSNANLQKCILESEELRRCVSDIFIATHIENFCKGFARNTWARVYAGDLAAYEREGKNCFLIP